MTTIYKNELLERWAPVLEGISDQQVALTTAHLLENQAKAFIAERTDEEAIGTGTTTVGKLGTFQKWAFPMIRRIFPELIYNKIGATQAMDGPVSQVFYQGNSRVYGANTVQTMYSAFKVTPYGLTAGRIGSTSGVSGNWGTASNSYASALTGGKAATGFDTSNVLNPLYGSPSTTMGGQIASWPNGNTILGWSVSAGERLSTSGIPEVTMHIQKQTVQARTRKMRALWTLEAAQDLKAYHNMDLENELTELLSKEIALEIDRELIEDIRMIAYGIGAQSANPFGGWYLRSLFNGGADNFQDPGGIGPDGGTFNPGSYQWDLPAGVAAEISNTDWTANMTNSSGSNIYVMDLATFNTTSLNFAPQHLGHVFSNVLALINFASQDIYRTTFKGPGTVLITSPLIASMLESAAKLEGGLPLEGKPTNQDGKTVSYVGKFMGKYDMIVDPMFPEDEIIVGYKGSSNMDAGLVYCPYIPLMPLPTVTDPETFQPRKGVLTRYGKLAIQPASRYYRIIRLVGTGADYITKNIFRNNASFGTSVTGGY
jgi:hypothetical protein